MLHSLCQQCIFVQETLAPVSICVFYWQQKWCSKQPCLGKLKSDEMCLLLFFSSQYSNIQTKCNQSTSSFSEEVRLIPCSAIFISVIAWLHFRSWCVVIFTAEEITEVILHSFPFPLSFPSRIIAPMALQKLDITFAKLNSS